LYQNKKIVVVMPAYNAEKTLLKTYEEVMAQGIVDTVIFVDDASFDGTAKIASGLPQSKLFVHEKNLGYGGNQKTCYRLALEEGADIVIMVHPDYQYTPKLIPAMASLISSGLYHCVLGSRILGGYALKGGMPIWKYIANRFLTLAENILIGAKLSEYHTGYRAFSRELLLRLEPYVRAQLQQGVALKHISKALLGLFHAQPGGRLFRQILSLEAPSPQAGWQVVVKALAQTEYESLP